MDGIIFPRLDDFGIVFALYCSEQLNTKHYERHAKNSGNQKGD